MIVSKGLAVPRKAFFHPVSWRLAGLALLVSVIIIGSPEARAAERERLVAFLEITGFDVALDSIALSAVDAPQMLGMTASDFGTQWTALAEEVFDTGNMRAMALDILQETLSDDMLSHAADFYASPLGQRLVEVENASHMIEDDDAKRAEGEALVAGDVTAGSERVSVLRQLNTAIDSDGNAVRAVREIQVRFLMAASLAGVLEQELDEQSLRALLQAQDDELRIQLQLSALAGAAYTYQKITLDDLQAYLAALGHPTMQQVYQLMNAVQHEIMANRFEVLATRMAGLERGQDL